MTNPESKFYREKEAKARALADNAPTRSVQLLQLKSAEHFGGLALDAEQNVVTPMRARPK